MIRSGRLLLAPGIAWLALFTFVPMAVVLAMSLATRAHPVTWALDGSAWGRLLEPLWLRVLGRSAANAAAATAICVAFGAPLAWYIARRTGSVRRVLYFLVLVPLWANTVALLFAWVVVLRGDGLLDRTLRALGLLGDGATTGLLYSWPAVLLGTVYVFLPYMVYAVYQPAERFDVRLLEAAADLGATRAQAVRRVLVPALLPGIAAGAVLVFVPALGTFVVPDMLGGAKSAFVGNVIRDRLLTEPSDWPLASAMSVTLLALTGLSAWAWFRHGETAR